MKSLITGGAGFVGSHLAEALLARGDTVCVVDDLSTGCVENVRHPSDYERFSFVHGNILDRDLLSVSIQKADVVYHLAAAVGVRRIVERPLEAIQINLWGTENVLELCARWSKKVLISSSSEVYGKSRDIPYREDGDSLFGPTTVSRWSYGCAKALDEFLALAYFRERGLAVVTARLFNVCGPRQQGTYGMVIPRFVRNALLSEPLIVYGNGTQSRCFTFVEDAVRALIGLMDAEDTVGEVFNVGNTEEVRIRDLAARILDLTGSPSKIELVPYEQAYGLGVEDVMRRVPDIRKINEAIGWRPTVSLEEMLRHIIAHEKAHLATQDGIPSPELPRRTEESPFGERPTNAGHRQQERSKLNRVLGRERW